MRDPERFNDFYKELKELHQLYFPDWRFMQMMSNFMSWHYNTYKTDGFYIEENKFLERFRRFIKEMALMEV